MSSKKTLKLKNKHDRMASEGTHVKSFKKVNFTAFKTLKKNLTTGSRSCRRVVVLDASLSFMGQSFCAEFRYQVGAPGRLGLRTSDLRSKIRPCRTGL